MHDLGGLDEDAASAARAINEWGTVVGSAEDAVGGVNLPVVWKQRTIARLPFEGTSGSAVDINNWGQIIGNAGFSECLLWRNAGTAPIRLAGLGGTFCLAIAINDAGAVVGAATTATGDLRAFVWRDGVVDELEAIEDLPYEYSFSELLDVNSTGLAVGRVVSSGLNLQPFLWSPKKGGRILQMSGTSAAAVNDWGAIALIDGLEPSRLLVAHESGVTIAFGELGGAVSHDGLSLNNWFEIAWTELAGEPLRFQAYACQLRWPGPLEADAR